jgi:hypothetical protein
MKKIIPVETIPEMGGGRIKESSGETESKHDIFEKL